MGMYIMNGKTFLKTYINEDPDLVMRTQFVLVSSSIRKSGRYEKQVLNSNAMLYPPNMMMLDYEDYHDPEYVERYTRFLEDNAKPFIATLVRYCLDESDNVIFLCSLKEWKFRYLQILRKFILEEFAFHVYDYKKVKDGKEKIVEDDDTEVYSICRRVLKKAQKEKIASMKSSEKGRQDYVRSLEKDELIQKLKKKNLYIKGMSKSEMIETLEIFI